MKLYIPEIKDQLLLKKDWTFTLYPEYRNEKLGEKIGVLRYKGWGAPPRAEVFCYRYKDDSIVYDDNYLFPVTLPKGTIIQVDRIYIRKGKKEFSSISFWIKNGEYKGARFWAKLEEVNKIEFE